MRGNVKLVMSVAKGWMRNGYAVAGANGDGAPGRGGSGLGSVLGRGDDGAARRQLAQMYDGWDRPSLDGPCRRGCSRTGARHGQVRPGERVEILTYATHWLQRAVTGCLRVPGQLHEIKAAYNRIVRDHLHLGGSSVEPLDRTSMAQRLGISGGGCASPYGQRGAA
ncbi:hypothetical protein ACHAW5_003828 [Stephanodiscus triporus]|uniref:Uncharacterized protein n=1 Tax=Stephanodiscus triporus TaxID=2934178 RepID=A0ABD3QZV6_9STRA